MASATGAVLSDAKRSASGGGQVTAVHHQASETVYLQDEEHGPLKQVPNPHPISSNLKFDPKKDSLILSTSDFS